MGHVHALENKPPWKWRTECPPCRVRIATAIASNSTRPASVHAAQAANHSGDVLIAGFAKELFEAQSDEADSTQPAPSGAQSNPSRSGKNTKQQAKPSKPGAEPIAAPATSTPAAQSAPLRLGAFGIWDANGQIHREASAADGAATASATAIPTVPLPFPEIPLAASTPEPAPQPKPAPATLPAPADNETKISTSSPHHGAPSGELAFAARVQPAAAAADASQSAKRPASAQPQESTSKKDAKDTEELPAGQVATAATPLPSAPSNQAAYTVASVPAPAPAAATHAAPPQQQPPIAHVVEPKIVETPKPVAAPLRDLSIQVDQSGASNVQVRVTQQAGELRVAVRTGDADLAHGLQQGLNDLVGRLQENGFRAEAWRPGATPQYSATAETNHNPSNSHQGDSQSFSGGSQQQRQDERRQNQSSRPAWVEEMEGSLNGRDSQTQGATYGIRS